MEEKRKGRKRSERQKTCIKDRKNPYGFSERSVLSERETETECRGKREGSRMGENTSGRN